MGFDRRKLIKGIGRLLVGCPLKADHVDGYSMHLVVAFRGGSRFDLISSAHTVITDQPKEDGGEDVGMTPVELFVGSLATCVGYFVARYCARHDIPTAGLSIDADWTMAEQPHRVGTVAIRLHLPSRLTPSQEEKLLKVAHACTVHQSIAVPPKIEINLLSAPDPHAHAGNYPE